MIERQVKAPIILIGFARSGTTFLGQALVRHPEVAYMAEPRTIWSYGNAYLDHDELEASDLTPAIARRIDRAFARHVAKKGGTRFAEKTPSNCLRVGFVHALYPDARIVHLIRDGRAVVRSLLKAQADKPFRGAVRKRLRQTPFWEWPAYVPGLARTVVRTRVLNRPSTYWGPHPRGWREWMELPPHVRAARQWRVCVDRAIRDLEGLPDASVLDVRYEELVAEPVQWMEKIMDFAGLEPSEAVLEHVGERADPTRYKRWVGTLSETEEAEVEAEMEPLATRIGYGERE